MSMTASSLDGGWTVGVNGTTRKDVSGFDF